MHCARLVGAAVKRRGVRCPEAKRGARGAASGFPLSTLPINRLPKPGDERMLTEYIEEAMKRARYELIEDPEAPFYGEIRELPGVWARAATLEICRRELKDTVEGWILLSVKRSLPIPKLGDAEIAEIGAEAA